MDPTPPAGRPRLLALLTLAAAIPAALAALASAAGFLLWEGELIATETVAAVNARRHAAGGALYGDWREYPHLLTQYGPALYLPPALATRTLGLNLRGTLLAGRLVSAVAMAALLPLLVVACTSRGTRGALAAVPVALLVGSELMTQFAVMFRADIPSLLLQVAGLIVLERTADTRRRFLLATVPFTLACGYKQTAVLGIAAGVGWLAATGRRRQAAALAGSMAAVALVAVTIAQWVTDGRFLLGTVKGVHFPEEWRLTVELAMTCRRVWPLLAAGVLALSFGGTRRAMGPFAAFLVLGIAWGILGGRHTGAWVQYYFEAAASATVALATLVRRWPTPVLGASLLLALLQGLDGARRLPDAVAAVVTREHAAATRALYDDLVAEVKAEPGVLLSQDAYLAVVAGQPESATDAFDVSCLLEAGLLRDTATRELIASGRANPIVVRDLTEGPGVPRWPRSWSDAMRGRYRRTRTFASGHVVLRPVRAQGPSR